MFFPLLPSRQLQFGFGLGMAMAVSSCSLFGGGPSQSPSVPSPAAENPVSPAPGAPGNPQASPPGTALQGPEGQPSGPLTEADKNLTRQLAEETATKGSIARQDVGKTHLDNILILQQTERFVSGSFVDTLPELSPDLPTETDEYQLQITQADDSQAIAVAIPKKPGLTSYIGVAYAIEANVPISGICKSNLPSQQAPNPPKLVGTTVVCASGSTAVE